MFDTQTKNIAESTILLAIARISMAATLPVFGVITYLGGQWLDQKFEMQDNKITAQAVASTNQDRITTARIETVERTATSRTESVERTATIAVDAAAKVNERLIAVETKQTQDSAASERFQAATLQRLDRMQDSIIAMSNAVAALTATLQAERDRSP